MTLSYNVVYFQYHWDEVFGVISYNNINIFGDNRALFYSTSIGVFSFTCFLIGYLFYVNFKLVRINVKYGNSTLIYRLFALPIFIIYILVTDPLYFLGGNGVISPGAMSDYMALLLNSVLTAQVVFGIRGVKYLGKSTLQRLISVFGKINLFVLFLFLLLNLLSGERGLIIYWALLLMLCSKIEMSLKRLTLISLMGVVSLTYLGRLRGYRGNMSMQDRLVLAAITSDEDRRFGFTSSFPLTQNLAHSGSVYYRLVGEVRDENIHESFLLKELLSVIPFGNQLKSSLIFPNDSDWQKNSAAYSSYRILNRVSKTNELGTTILTPFWLDYGLMGAFVGMLLVGTIGGYSDNLLKNGLDRYAPPFLLTISIIFFANSIYVARGSFFSIFKFAFWTLLMVYVQIIFTSIFSKSKS